MQRWLLAMWRLGPALRAGWNTLVLNCIQHKRRTGLHCGLAALYPGESGFLRLIYGPSVVTGGGSPDPPLGQLVLLRGRLASLPLFWSYIGLENASAFLDTLPRVARAAAEAAPAPMLTSTALPAILSCGGGKLSTLPPRSRAASSS